VVLAAFCLTGSAGHAHPRLLRACVDPNNLPFSNESGQGLEDKLGLLLAKRLGMGLERHFWAQRRGFVRNTLKAQACDVILGVPKEFDLALTTAPYYRSSYVFVTRTDRALRVHSLDDPRLRQLKLGVPIVGDDYANPPPVHALSRRGIVNNVVGYSVFGDYARESPPLELVRAVDRGDIDVALAWGPVAGFVARRSQHPLRLAPLAPAREGPHRFVFDIALGVRKGDVELKTQLEAALKHERKQIQELLHDFGVPLI
jgi:quinoprotein dehydrogenase-associated probable ABC transporter substrate-binding protein